jgi:hypothetical protein
MSLRNKPVMVRLSNDLASRFERLCHEFRGLAPATVMRLMVAAQLAKSLDEQVNGVTAQIRKGEGHLETTTPSTKAAACRLSRLNTKPR